MNEDLIFEQARLLLETKVSELRVRGYSRLKRLIDNRETEDVRFGTVIITFSSWAQLNPDGSLSVITEARKARFLRRSRVTALGFYMFTDLEVQHMEDNDLKKHGYGS